MDYKNGRIYKITSDSTDKIYIGSTCQPLYKRMGEHRCSYKRFLNGNKIKSTSYELIKLDDAIITLIEDYPCERKEQLHARERYHIELNKDICINKNIPTRTKKEWYEENKEGIAEKDKQYQDTNKEKIKEQKNEYYQCNKEKIKEQRKEYYYTNTEKIKEYKSKQITCECGKEFLIINKSRHEKSKLHIAFIQSHS